MSDPLLPGVRQNTWPQAAGPFGNWKHPDSNAPTHWSVTRNEHIVWRTPLPNGGQGGITVWGDRLFLVTFEEYHEGEPLKSATVQGHCLDLKTGRLIWSVTLKGENASPMMYAYSDSTSWTPVTDGQHVWFFNCSGEMGCWDFSGKPVWRRSFLAPGEPFNKQHEPILLGDTIITLEPLAPDEPGYRPEKSFWHYLRGIDKRTGKTLWVAEDATTYYCTSVAGQNSSGDWCIVHGRGGPHDVPERPIGMSMTSLAPGKEGRTVWRYVPDAQPGGPVDGTTFQALYTMTWDRDSAYWFRNAPEESHLVIASSNGTLSKQQSLIRNVDFRQWNPDKQEYITRRNVNIRDIRDLSPRVPLKSNEVLHVFPNWHANLVAHGYHYFFTSTGHRRNGYAPPGLSGPSHSVGRVNVTSGKVEYLELPVSVIRKPGQPDEMVYGKAVNTLTIDNKGRNVGLEDRSRTDGWQIPAFFGSPTCVGDFIYMSTMLGITYVLNAKAKELDENALIAVNDLGPSGETWSLNSISYVSGRLFHRSLREVVCIGK